MQLLFKVKNLFLTIIDSCNARYTYFTRNFIFYTSFHFKLDGGFANAKDNAQLQLDVQTAV